MMDPISEFLEDRRGKKLTKLRKQVSRETRIHNFVHWMFFEDIKTILGEVKSENELHVKIGERIAIVARRGRGRLFRYHYVGDSKSHTCRADVFIQLVEEGKIKLDPSSGNFRQLRWEPPTF